MYFVGRILVLIRGEVWRKGGRRGSCGQGLGRPYRLSGSFATVCSDFYGQLVRWVERGGKSYWFWLCSGWIAMVVLFGALALVAQFVLGRANKGS